MASVFQLPPGPASVAIQDALGGIVPCGVILGGVPEGADPHACGWLGKVLPVDGQLQLHMDRLHIPSGRPLGHVMFEEMPSRSELVVPLCSHRSLPAIGGSTCCVRSTSGHSFTFAVPSEAVGLRFYEETLYTAQLRVVITFLRVLPVPSARPAAVRPVIRRPQSLPEA
jgi:hypothetical protein